MEGDRTELGQWLEGRYGSVMGCRVVWGGGGGGGVVVMVVCVFVCVY